MLVMLIDYISPDKLPTIIVWLDWNLYANWLSLLVCLGLMFMHHIYKTPFSHLTSGGASIALFCGFCFWCFYCATIRGYAVG